MNRRFPAVFLLGFFLSLALVAGNAAAQIPKPWAPPQNDAGEDVPGVWRVRNQGVKAGARPEDQRACIAERGNEIWFDITNLPAWLAEVRGKENRGVAGTAPATPLTRDEIFRLSRELVPYFNDIPLTGVHPVSIREHWYQDESGARHHMHYLCFALARDPAVKSSRVAWARLLKEPRFQRQMDATVGFENGEVLRTYVLREEPEPERQFILRLLPLRRLVWGLAILLGSLALFWTLARSTDLIRDPDSPLRPDGRRPYSLARSQMAFWFFLVIGSYFILWVLTGDLDTLNTSALALVGISATTALGAVFVGAPKSNGQPLRSNRPPVDLAQPRAAIVAQLTARLAEARAALTRLQTARGAINQTDEKHLAINARELRDAGEDVEALQAQLGYFQRPAWKGVLHDLLAENNLISFHRFQIFVWTLVLGLMFVSNVYNELAMPEFSATLLGLLGISAGTYLGFKLPAAQPSPAPQV